MKKTSLMVRKYFNIVCKKYCNYSAVKVIYSIKLKNTLGLYPDTRH